MSVANHLTDWDWTTLVAAWRHYEHRMTAASVSFPAELVTRFFGGRYAAKDCQRIARQFVEIDHRAEGEAEWRRHDDCDRRPWCKLYAFLKAYLGGWKTVRGVECFYCETTGRNYPKGEYIKNPWVECWVVEKDEERDERKGVAE